MELFHLRGSNSYGRTLLQTVYQCYILDNYQENFSSAPIFLLVWFTNSHSLICFMWALMAKARRISNVIYSIRYDFNILENHMHDLKTVIGLTGTGIINRFPFYLNDICRRKSTSFQFILCKKVFCYYGTKYFRGRASFSLFLYYRVALVSARSITYPKIRRYHLLDFSGTLYAASYLL